MGTTATTAFILFLVLLAIGAGAFVLALTVARMARLRYQHHLAAARRARSWGGKHHDRVRTKYFDKERRARAARERTRGSHAPPPGNNGNSRDPAPVISDRERACRETLGLVGVELTPYVLREAYRARVREYHPDRVAGLGVKLRVLAEEETKRINDAYRHLSRRLEPIPDA